MRGRFASGIMRSMDLDDLVASTADAYVDKVAQLCTQPAVRERVRGQLAQRRGALFNDVEAAAALGRLLLEFN